MFYHRRGFNQQSDTDYSLNSVNNQVTVTRYILTIVKVFKCSDVIGIFLLITESKPVFIYDERK